ncbi:hypothetical protein BRADI_3g59841v3 [Brachypodium distachyon]|uniref:Uncharacterized protein n=1 Tax=Brachypodium distachyon TaxID=15368 RepID=A0A2K2D5W4_BRADI|nr:hypothetical protein BRADI_3g59841v3 [Brachypodium distachyon]
MTSRFTPPAPGKKPPPAVPSTSCCRRRGRNGESTCCRCWRKWRWGHRVAPMIITTLTVPRQRDEQRHDAHSEHNCRVFTLWHAWEPNLKCYLQFAVLTVQNSTR